MARRNNSRADTRANIVFDTRTKAVMAQTPQDDVKGKVQSVREIVPGKSNNEIILVLQYYDNNVERTIQAYLEDGAKEALTQWQFSGTKTANKKKKRKPKPTNQAAQDKPIDQSEGSTHIEERSIADTPPLVNGTNPHAYDDGATSESAHSSPQSSSEQQRPLPQRNRREHGHTHHAGSHSNHTRERTISEQSTSSVGSTSQKGKKPHAGLEKSLKDLHRHALSVDRLKRVLTEEVEKGHKRIKTVFEEMFQALKERESLLLAELDVVKFQALETFSMRQSQSVDLKIKGDRAPNLSEADLSELRSEIKNYVADRKIDEDLGRTTRFLYDSDKLKEEISSFGEVVPVRCAYSKRRPSVSSVVSQSSEHMDTNISIATGGGALVSNSATPVISSTTATTNSSSSSRQGEIIDVQDAQEMAEIQRKLKASLRLQGLTVKSPPRQGRQPQSSNQQRSGSGGQGKGGSEDNGKSGSQGQRSGPSGQRSGPQGQRSDSSGQRLGSANQRSTENGSHAGPGGDDIKKSRNAKRRQKQRERQQAEFNSSEDKSTHNSNGKQSPSKEPSVSSGPATTIAQNNKSDISNGKSSDRQTNPKEPQMSSNDQSKSHDHKNGTRSPGEKDRQNSDSVVKLPKSDGSSGRNSATVSLNGGHSPEKTPKRAEVVVNGDIHKE